MLLHCDAIVLRCMHSNIIMLRVSLLMSSCVLPLGVSTQLLTSGGIGTARSTWILERRSGAFTASFGGTARVYFKVTCELQGYL